MKIKKYSYIILFLLFLSTNLYSQFYFFGRNKVQYDQFDWRILKTEHFDIYYYSEFEEMAEIGAAYAEDAYENLKVKFNIRARVDTVDREIVRLLKRAGLRSIHMGVEAGTDRVLKIMNKQITEFSIKNI